MRYRWLSNVYQYEVCYYDHANPPRTFFVMQIAIMSYTALVTEYGK